MTQQNAVSVQSLADAYFHPIKASTDLSLLKEALAKAQSLALRNLAAAMRKTLPDDMVQEIIDRADPLGAFLLELRKPMKEAQELEKPDADAQPVKCPMEARNDA